MRALLRARVLRCEEKKKHNQIKFPAQVQAAGVQNAALGRETAQGYAHQDEFAKVTGLRAEQSSREDREDVQQGTGS